MLGRGGHEVAPRVLLEQVVDGLHGGDLAACDRLQALLAPADRWAEGHAVVAELALRSELFERLETVVVVDGVETRVVQLI